MGKRNDVVTRSTVCILLFMILILYASIQSIAKIKFVERDKDDHQKEFVEDHDAFDQKDQQGMYKCNRWNEKDCSSLMCRKQDRNSDVCKCMNERTRVVPKLFLIGCQKCGSTSLHTALVSRKDDKYAIVQAKDVKRFNENKIEIGIAGKELHFFDNSKRFQRGLGYYFCHFPLKEDAGVQYEDKFTIDSTPDYLSVPHVAERIYNTYSRMSNVGPADLKFIVIVRDPVQRLLSWYNMGRNAGWLYKTNHCTDRFLRSHNDAIVDCSGTFEEAVVQMMRLYDKCKYRLTLNITSDTIDMLDYDWETIYNTCLGSISDGSGWPLLRALLNGFYQSQLNHFFKHFSRSQFFITSLYRYTNNPRSVMNELYDFIGVEETQRNLEDTAEGVNRKNDVHNSRNVTYRDDDTNSNSPLYISPQTRDMLCHFYSASSALLKQELLQENDVSEKTRSMTVSIDLSAERSPFGDDDWCD